MTRDATGVSARFSLWWRRAAGYLLGCIIPWSLLSQLLGTVLTGRSWPEGSVGSTIVAASFLAISLLSAAVSTNGRSPTDRLLGLRAVQVSGTAVSRTRLAMRNVAHVLDFVLCGLGFLLPLVSARGQTIADLVASTIVERVDEEPHAPRIMA